MAQAVPPRTSPPDKNRTDEFQIHPGGVFSIALVMTVLLFSAFMGGAREVYHFTTDTFGLTSEDFFLMPDRSLTIIGEADSTMYLNIPGQFLVRDSVTQRFTFTGLFFSNEAMYDND